MKFLQLHSDFIEYEPVKKEIKEAEEAEKRKVRYEDIVVFFTSVEKSDDTTIVKKAVCEISKSLEKLKLKNVLIYPYAHLSNDLATPRQALTILKSLEEEVSKSGFTAYRSPFGWNKSFSIQVKGHPLAEQSKSIVKEEAKEEKIPEALKAEEKIRSTWHIVDTDGKLTALDKYDFKGKNNLKKLVSHETATSRSVHQTPPHVELMKRLAIADYEPGSDPGNLRFYPRGRLIKSLLEQYVTKKVVKYGGMEVETPIMYDYHHPSLADYLNRFPARQYTIKSEDKDLFLRFSACFGQFLMAHDTQFSYKQTPLRLYELTRYSFRREKRGELVGLRRLRAFTMPDCHALCADLDQAEKEFVTRFNLSLDVLEGIGLTRDDIVMTIRFTEDFYKENKDFITSLVKIINQPVLVEMWKERFFYFVLKWEFNFIDNLGKATALSTDQIDVENSKRYGITFTDESGEEKYPIILHNSPSGAIERDIYALLEKAYANQRKGEIPSIPLWLSPTQVRLIPLSSRFVDFAEKMAFKLEEKMIRVDIDDRDETVQKRIREAEREWVRYIMVLGDREVVGKTLAIRDREERILRKLSLEDLMKEIDILLKEKPRLPLPPPRLLSARPQFT